MRRLGISIFGLVALAGIVVVLVAAASDERTTAFSIDQQLATPVATATPGHLACQAPIQGQAAFKAVEFWTMPVSPRHVVVTVADARIHRLLASGAALETPSLQTGTLNIAQTSRFRVALDQLVPAGRALVVCLGTRDPAPLSIVGSSASPYTGRSADHLDNAFALVFDRAHARSLLAQIGTALHRAALYSFSWAGGWTMWLLLVAVITAVGGAGWALALAITETEQEPRGGAPAASADRAR